MAKKDLFGLNALNSLSGYSLPKGKKSGYSLPKGKKQDDFGLGSIDSFSVFAEEQKARPRTVYRRRAPSKRAMAKAFSQQKKAARLQFMAKEKQRKAVLLEEKRKNKAFGRFQSLQQAQEAAKTAERERMLESQLRSRYNVDSQGRLKEKTSSKVLGFLKKKITGKGGSIYE